MSHSYYHQLSCVQCGAREQLRPDDLLSRLRAAGVLRRAVSPDAAEIVELFRANLNTMACAACGAAWLSLAEVAEEQEDWGDPVSCERCGKPIPAERVELFPGAKLCVACQKASEHGEDVEVEYCPRCGSAMQLRKTRSGITRYVMECPGCR